LVCGHLSKDHIGRSSLEFELIFDYGRFPCRNEITGASKLNHRGTEDTELIAFLPAQRRPVKRMPKAQSFWGTAMKLCVLDCCIFNKCVHEHQKFQGHPLKGLDQEKNLPHRKRNTFSRAALQQQTDNKGRREWVQPRLVGGGPCYRFAASLSLVTFIPEADPLLTARETFSMSLEPFQDKKACSCHSHTATNTYTTAVVS